MLISVLPCLIITTWFLKVQLWIECNNGRTNGGIIMNWITIKTGTRYSPENEHHQLKLNKFFNVPCHFQRFWAISSCLPHHNLSCIIKRPLTWDYSLVLLKTKVNNDVLCLYHSFFGHLNYYSVTWLPQGVWATNKKISHAPRALYSLRSTAYWRGSLLWLHQVFP